VFGESDSIQLDTYSSIRRIEVVARVQAFRDFVVSKASAGVLNAHATTSASAPHVRHATCLVAATLRWGSYCFYTERPHRTSVPLL